MQASRPVSGDDPSSRGKWGAIFEGVGTFAQVAGALLAGIAVFVSAQALRETRRQVNAQTCPVVQAAQARGDAPALFGPQGGSMVVQNIGGTVARIDRAWLSPHRAERVPLGTPSSDRPLTDLYLPPGQRVRLSTNGPVPRVYRHGIGQVTVDFTDLSNELGGVLRFVVTAPDYGSRVGGGRDVEKWEAQPGTIDVDCDT